MGVRFGIEKAAEKGEPYSFIQIASNYQYGTCVEQDEKKAEEYYKKADRSEKPFVFVVITHSSEATMKDGKGTQALEDLEKFIVFSKKYKDVTFVTMKEAYGKILVS